MERIDFHAHTTASDGIFSPVDLIDFAVKNECVALAITDHDTVDGLAPAIEHAQSIGFRLFPGVEFSIDYGPGSFHLVGFNIDHRHQELRQQLKWLAERRETRARRIIEDLNRHKIDISMEEVEVYARGGSVGRPHIARVLVERGYADTVKGVFQNYLVKGKPGFIKKDRIRFERAIELVHDAGGIPVIAHPISLDLGDFEAYERKITELKESGVEGIEVYAAMHSIEQVQAFRDIADRLGLMVSGGSDFHGDKDEIIGYYKPEMPIPIEVLQGVEDRLAGSAGRR